MENLQTNFNTDDIHNIVEEGEIENVQCEDECSNNMEQDIQQ